VSDMNGQAKKWDAIQRGRQHGSEESWRISRNI
jgi:hypothetical protein